VSLWVVDSSVFLADEDMGDAHQSTARQLLESVETLVTLDLAWYETANVAAVSWKDPIAAERLHRRVSAFAENGRLLFVSANLIENASAVAVDHAISLYDAAYVAAATAVSAQLVSCDERDLVSRGLAVTPTDVVAALAVAEEGTEPVASDDADDEEPS
jgi:predicted nucleic acid-binding protein